LNRLTIDQINFFKLLHPAKYFRCIKSVCRFCNHTFFNPAKPSFDRIFPFFIRNIKQIRENMNFDFPSVPVAQRTLQFLSRLFQFQRIRFSVVLEIFDSILFFFDVFFRFMDRNTKFRQFICNIIKGQVKMCPQFFT